MTFVRVHVSALRHARKVDIKKREQLHHGCIRLDIFVGKKIIFDIIVQHTM